MGDADDAPGKGLMKAEVFNEIARPSGRGLKRGEDLGDGGAKVGEDGASLGLKGGWTMGGCRGHRRLGVFYTIGLRAWEGCSIDYSLNISMHY